MLQFADHMKSSRLTVDKEATSHVDVFDAFRLSGIKQFPFVNRFSRPTEIAIQAVQIDLQSRVFHEQLYCP